MGECLVLNGRGVSTSLLMWISWWRNVKHEVVFRLRAARGFFLNNPSKPLFPSCRTETDSNNDSTFALGVDTKAVNAALKLVFYIYQLVNYLPLYADALSVFAVDTASQVIVTLHQQTTWPSSHTPVCALICMCCMSLDSVHTIDVIHYRETPQQSTWYNHSTHDYSNF